jgi:hypothetical protein
MCKLHQFIKLSAETGYDAEPNYVILRQMLEEIELPE